MLMLAVRIFLNHFFKKKKLCYIKKWQGIRGQGVNLEITNKAWNSHCWILCHCYCVIKVLAASWPVSIKNPNSFKSEMRPNRVKMFLTPRRNQDIEPKTNLKHYNTTSKHAKQTREWREQWKVTTEPLAAAPGRGQLTGTHCGWPPLMPLPPLLRPPASAACW